MGVMNYRFICNKKNLGRYDNVKKQNNKIKSLCEIVDDNIDECVFQAVMANEIDASMLYSAVEFPTFLSPGEVGCALSHLSVYKDFLSSKSKYIYIFEDDCNINESLFTREFIDDVDQFMLAHEEEGTILLLQHASNIEELKEQKNKRTKEQKNTLGDCKIYRARECYCTHGYIINRQAASKICEIQTPLKFEIDIFKYYFWLGIADIYVLNTDVVSVKEGNVGQSDIGLLGKRQIGKCRRRMQYAKYKAIEHELPFRSRMRARMLRLKKNICKFL